MVKAIFKRQDTQMTEVLKHNFKNLDGVERSRIATLGGKKAQELGTAHRFTSDSARNAGLKGAAVRREKAQQRAALLQSNREVQS